jgi:hypothetical protein
MDWWKIIHSKDIHRLQNLFLKLCISISDPDLVGLSFLLSFINVDF